MTLAANPKQSESFATDQTRSSSLGESFIAILWIIWLGLMLAFVALKGHNVLTLFIGSVPQLLFVVGPLSLAVVTVIVSRKLWLVALSVLGIAIGATQVQVNWQPEPLVTSTTNSTEVTVFNWNTSMWDSGKDLDNLSSFLQSQEADIYLLQERFYNVNDEAVDVSIRTGIPPYPLTRATKDYEPVYVSVPTEKLDHLRTYFPGFYAAEHKQFLVLSRFPIIESYLSETDQFQTVKVNINNQALTLFNVHMPVHLDLGLTPFNGFFQAISRSNKARAIGFNALESDVANTTGDYLIAGDFNTTHQMGQMKALEATTVDLFNYGNEPFPSTFSLRGFSVWKIDHVLLNNGSQFKVTEFKNIRLDDLSDHTAQKFTLALPSTNTASE